MFLFSITFSLQFRHIRVQLGWGNTLHTFHLQQEGRRPYFAHSKSPVSGNTNSSVGR